MSEREGLAKLQKKVEARLAEMQGSRSDLAYGCSMAFEEVLALIAEVLQSSVQTEKE